MMYESLGKLLTALERRRYIAVSRNDPHFMFTKKRKKIHKDQKMWTEPVCFYLGAEIMDDFLFLYCICLYFPDVFCSEFIFFSPEKQFE